MTDKKIDRRVRYTKKAIRESFLDLLEEKPLEKISVTEICKNADINRGTFYSHYTDPFELKESLEQELIDMFTEAAKTAPNGCITALSALNILKDNRDLCRLFCGPNGDMNALTKIIHEYSLAYFSDMVKDGVEIPEVHETCLLEMLVSAVGALVKFWYVNGMKDDPALIAECMSSFCHGGTVRFCENVSKNFT